MRLLDHIMLALRGVFASKFSLLSNTVSVFVGLTFFAALVCLAVGVGQFLEKYYTRTMSLTTLLAFRNPDAIESQSFDPAYRRGIREASGAEIIIYHDIDFADLAITQDRSVTVSLRSAIENDPEIERLELVAGANLPKPKSPLTPDIVIPLARAQRLSALPPQELIGLEVALTFARSARLEDEDEQTSLYGRIVGIVNETPDSSVYVHYSVLATMTAWARAVRKAESQTVDSSEERAVDGPTAAGKDVTSEPADSPSPVGKPLGGPDKAPTKSATEKDTSTPAETSEGRHAEEKPDAPGSGDDAPMPSSKPSEPEVPSSENPKGEGPSGADGETLEGDSSKNGEDSATKAPGGVGKLVGDGESIFRYHTPNETWNDLKASVEADTIVYPHLRIHLPNISALEKLREHFRSTGISTTSALDDVAAIRQLRNYALMVGSSIGLITLISAMCSIFNTLLASVERRTQEIGILRALGASTPTVLAVFLLEGAINAIIGGVLAVIVVYFGALYANDWIIQRLAANPEFERLVELNPQLFAYPGWLPVAVISVGLVASLLAALPSAIKACAMQPSNALRHT